ncbi:RNA polymerase sigma-70 factor, sigma-E family [Micromonospora haikouensis]|uniref:RNA polymerase sigma-70 factor, sigma-E family n=1 Tax=Micromonospora haikouensis TaxID=686309 RepID=A0A1C4YCB9_9ACTN|nr:RNA polymerase sigma-70 factor, sigma-E family [Micromonospora haikouensis]
MTEDSFREFVEIRYADLLRTAYLLTGSRHAAEDLVQSALIRVMRRWRHVDNPVAYVRRIMVNERVSLWHRFGSREFLAGVTGAWRLHAGQSRGPDVADDVVLRDEVLTALLGLPPRMRAVLVLRYWEDLPEAQIAEALRCSVGTVKSQASRGLARLRAVLPASPAGSPSSPAREPSSDTPAPSSDIPAPSSDNPPPSDASPVTTRGRGVHDGR